MYATPQIQSKKRPHPIDRCGLVISVEINRHPYQYPHPSPPRFRPIRLRFEARTELIVVVRVLVLLIHRRIATLRLPVIALLLRGRRLPRHLRVNGRIIAIDRFARLALLRLLVHGHLVGQTPPDAHPPGVKDSKPAARQRSKHRRSPSPRLELPGRSLRQIKNIRA